MKTTAQIFILFILLGVNSLGFIYHHECDMPCCQTDAKTSCCSNIKHNLCETSLKQCTRAIYLPFPVLLLETTDYNPSLDITLTINSTNIHYQTTAFNVNIDMPDYSIIPPLLVNSPLLI